MDKVKVTILPNGDIKCETDAITDGNHMQAEALMEFLASKFSPEVETIRKGQTHTHAHEHEHEKDKVKQ